MKLLIIMIIIVIVGCVEDQPVNDRASQDTLYTSSYADTTRGE